MINTARNYLIALLIVTVIFLADQFIKIKAILVYSFYLNQEAIFGLFKNNSLGIAFSLVITACLLYYLIKRPKLAIISSLIIGGVLSNLVDRFIHHGVIDYWHLMQRLWLNLADISIVIGVALLLNKYFKLLGYRSNDKE